MTDAPRRPTLRRAALLRVLDRLDAAPEPDAVTYYLPPGLPPVTLDAAIRAALALVGDGATGYAIFWGEATRLVVAPPFPVEHGARLTGFDAGPLRELLTRERALAVILVRLGGYSLGVYRGGRFVQTKTGGRFVKNRHRKGGQSQRRFERIREGQVREHFDAIHEAIHTRLEPTAGELDAVVLGGDRRTVADLLKRAPLPPALAAKLAPRVIDTPEPRLEVLEHSPAAIWSSRVAILAGFENSVVVDRDQEP
jgi:hypothetical protein